MSYANRMIMRKEERQSADVRGWKWHARDVVVCAGGLKDSGEVAFFAGVVLVHLGLCAKKSSGVGDREQ